MTKKRLLIANRGEIAIRIARTAKDLGFHTIGIVSEDDLGSAHARAMDQAVELKGIGPSAYLDAEQIVTAAKDRGCNLIHPGYGFLSENVSFAQMCEDTNLTFVGPDVETLGLFGNKAEARKVAQSCNVPVLEGQNKACSLEDIRTFRNDQPQDQAIIIKAIGGGGGRGMRVVTNDSDIESAYERARSEASKAFGNDAVYVERYIKRARHIEVQIIGDGKGNIQHLRERECSIQRLHQKIIEIAPAPNLETSLRQRINDAALSMARHVCYRNIGTFEFLVDLDATPPNDFVFIEANPRLQVEHTVTEEVMGVDLVALQLQIAQGADWSGLGLDQSPVPRGGSIQLRINTETMKPNGMVLPSSGTIRTYNPPTGPGIRLDGHAETGTRTSPYYDSLLTKLIVSTPSTDFLHLVKKAARALSEFQIEGLKTNKGLLQNILEDRDFQSTSLYTDFIKDRLPEIARVEEASPSESKDPDFDKSDPLAVLAHGKQEGDQPTLRNLDQKAIPNPSLDIPEGTLPVQAPLQGTVLSISIDLGDKVVAGTELMILEAMKMEHVIAAPASGTVRELRASPGDTVMEGHILACLDEGEVEGSSSGEAQETDMNDIRADLQEVIERHNYGQDEHRPDAVARRRKTGQLTARENLANLCDPDSFIEYGSLVIAAQRRRRELQDLIERTPADGMLAGIGAVNGDLFDERTARTAIASYDYTVLAGTQGTQNHRKKDRLFEVVKQNRLPLVFFTEGGGGRPGDTDGIGVAGLDCLAFALFGELSGLVPLIGINSGRCFAGNAALLGCCDVVIATKNSTIGMGGPAMIEGGNLGIYKPEEVGPVSVQVPNGVIDILVKDEEEAATVAKKYLSYFQGPLKDWTCDDQRKLRHIIPENRLRIYDVREVIKTLADEGSVLEVRKGFAPGMVTAFIRIEGRPIGVIANNPEHLAGAIDSDNADKSARFMQLCDAFDIPILFLCDTPGIMVGPEAEKTALVRHAARMFVTGASLTVPFFSVVLRKGYGLGAQAMAGGGFKQPVFTVSWPTGEFGGMGLEGAVKLGYRKELEAIKDPGERKQAFEEMVARAYERGKAVNMASHFEIDDVIDPADTRHWITRGLLSSPEPAPRKGKKRSCIDTW